MLVALVDFTVQAHQREAALETLLQSVDAVSAMPGCITYRPYTAPADPTMVCAVHEWETASDFAAYIGSDVFAGLGAKLRPMMTAPPSSRRYSAELLENPG